MSEDKPEKPIDMSREHFVCAMLALIVGGLVGLGANAPAAFLSLFSVLAAIAFARDEIIEAIKSAASTKMLGAAASEDETRL